jgi:hypothetical protein
MYTTRSAPLVHREGLLKLINDGIENVPATWKDIAPNTIKSKQAYEELLTHSGLGFFQNMDEAEGVTYDQVQTAYTKRYTPIIRTLGVKHTRQSRQKDLYGFVKAQAPMLSEAAVATLNLLSCNVLNLGFGGGTTSPDGQALFSTAHPLPGVGTTDSNLLTQALSGLALENALQVAMSHKGDRGIPKYYRGGFHLVVGPSLAGIANRAVNSVQLQGTSDNDTNSFVRGMIKKAPIVDQLVGFELPSMANNWYLLPAAPKDNPIFYMEVQPMMVDTDFDVDFLVTKYVASFECLFDVMNWRGTVGSQL